MTTTREFIAKAVEEIKKPRNQIEEESGINAKPHFIPLDLEILSTTLDKYLVSGVKAKTFLKDLENEYVSKVPFTIEHQGQSLYYKGTKLETLEQVRRYTPAAVYSGPKLRGLLFATKNSYNSVQTNLFSTVLNKVLVKHLDQSRYRGDEGNYSAGFDVGHVDMGYNNKLGSSIQAGIKAENTIGYLRQAFETSFHTAKAEDMQMVSKLHSLIEKAGRAEASYKVHATYATVINASFGKDFSEALLSVNANVVIIQDRIENQKHYRIAENKYVDLLKDLLKKFPLHQVHFSRSMEEEIRARIVDALRGVKSKSTKSKASHKAKVLQKAVIGATKGNLPSPQQIKLKNLETKRAIGLPRLLAILNNHLQDVVSANMQDPDDYDRGSRKLLTYRTGRFAESVKVERLSASREGAITAFYSYMKNPYATFSAGGRQQNPRSRDPKSLISRSIREIAAKYVAEQMRAVNV